MHLTLAFDLVLTLILYNSRGADPHIFAPPAGTWAGPQQPSAGTGNCSASVLSAALGHAAQGGGGGSHITHTQKPNTYVCVFAYARTPIIRKLLLKSSGHSHHGLISAVCFEQLPEFRNMRSKRFHLLLCYSRKSHFTFRQIFRCSAMFSLHWCTAFLCLLA